LRRTGENISLSRRPYGDVMIPNVLPEFLELTTEILLGFLPVNDAPTAWDRVRRKLCMVFMRAELRGHSQSRGEHVRCLALCVPGRDKGWTMLPIPFDVLRQVPVS
jgi:hypothetical protein